MQTACLTHHICLKRHGRHDAKLEVVRFSCLLATLAASTSDVDYIWVEGGKWWTFCLFVCLCLFFLVRCASLRAVPHPQCSSVSVVAVLCFLTLAQNRRFMGDYKLLLFCFVFLLFILLISPLEAPPLPVPFLPVAKLNLMLLVTHAGLLFFFSFRLFVFFSLFPPLAVTF